ncbi:Stk1 family PASTA domain-containing Ser/Thr kinase [Blastococcus goldschmidtiae]|uniref:non-specific serine/threonine protein kinase n=1 Tax=Blastococcus goldschmidtiae TaxID=3075546 RepID=A0ABU2K209_9ACTN|nr:Stk1 family PASTA domain-containing Ser/Thr kinase [Blastococcus sp. DSM 46792]MDT0274379.1 Stk1 family PASTA domain-containing Ser/Thr kinase [Blastococcus sp. DSM 46792]
MTTPQVLGERYEIGGVLGRGGMAEVHLGRDLRLGREVAVKVLRSDLARDPSFQVRFRREAQASASLNHPAIVAVYDTGEDRTALGATPYIVMEYVEGETLRDVLRREGALSPERAMTLAADISGALDFSHRNGIVHRDVKPGNVMITPQGTVKVMDFGIARAVSDSAATMTSTAAVIGTAQYLSPEQARGESVDARSDVYSLGCLLYELATGAPPFTGDSPVSVAYQHVREDPRLPSSINPAVPAELDAILLKAMSKNPANRYQSAAEMRNDLLRALAGQRVEATPVMGDAEKTAIIGAVPAGYDDWDGEEEQAQRRKRRIIIAVVSVLAVLLLGGAIAAAMSMGGDDPADDPVATQVQVPPLRGLPEAEARTALTDAGLEADEVTTRVTTVDTELGAVLDSDPAGGAQVARGTAVDLVVGVAPDTVLVPGVIGLDEQRARAALQAAGFDGTVQVEEVESLERPGSVAEVTPDEGQAVPPEGTVVLGISTGSIEVPDLRNRSEADARGVLTAAGFSEAQINTEQVDSDQPPGTVVATTPGGGSAASADTRIVLQVSGGPGDIVVLNVRGQSPSAAEANLRAAGFTDIQQQPTENDGSVREGTVLTTDPEPGTTVPATETIVLLVAGPDEPADTGDDDEGDGTGGTDSPGGGAGDTGGTGGG